MGQCNYHILGYGMTEAEAHNDAMQRDRSENGHQDGYSGGICSSTHTDDKARCIVKPVQAKTCTIDKNKQDGVRKWKTVFVIAPQFRDSQNYNTNHHVIIGTTQGDAINKAKEMALKFNRSFHITIEKRLEGNAKIATITPKKSKLGTWEFTGMARE